MSYFDIYKKRLNRYGENYQSRSRQQRIKVFEDLLQKSIYRVNFEYNGQMEPGLLERYKQDDTQTLQYLLTRLTLNLHGGDLLDITDVDGRTTKWMVYWLEYIEVSGYNRYILIKATSKLTWKRDLDKNDRIVIEQYGYFFGKQRAKMKNYDVGDPVLYFENDNNFTLVMPYRADKIIKEGDFLTVETEIEDQYFRVLNQDCVSTEGVVFVTVDPVYKYDESPVPEYNKIESSDNDNEDDYKWFTGDFMKEDK